MLRGPGSWLITKTRARQDPPGVSVERGDMLAWSRRVMSEWATELQTVDVELTHRKIRDLERVVTLTRIPPMERLHSGSRYVVQSWERALTPREQKDALPVGEPLVIEEDNQMEAVLRYADLVQEMLAFTEDRQRRRHLRLSEDLDLDVDLQRRQAWRVVAPVLQELKRADRQYKRIRKRLAVPMQQAMQVGIPAPPLAAEAGRTRQWVHQTARSLPLVRHLVNMARFLQDFGTDHPVWQASLVSPSELPLVEVEDEVLKQLVTRAVESLREPETTVRADEKHVIVTIRSSFSKWRLPADDTRDAWITRLERSVQPYLERLTDTGGALDIDADDPADSNSYYLATRTIVLTLRAVGVISPPRRGRPPGRSQRR
ncbi:hypothetical protein [Streptomyces sp. NPDC001083]|uniref:hypothetical protein n=1 Tax=Streptomyces sp. NPDC001083 TaxID=3364545 RepID=UPI0036BBE1B5